MTTSDTHRVIDAVWRIESAKLIATLARLVRDVGLAEELAQDALVMALQQWPEEGIPNNPGAWLMTTAKRRAIDRIRRDQMAARKYEELGRQLEMEGDMAADYETRTGASEDAEADENLLRLMFVACHPV